MHLFSVVITLLLVNSVVSTLFALREDDHFFGTNVRVVTVDPQSGSTNNLAEIKVASKSETSWMKINGDVMYVLFDTHTTGQPIGLYRLSNNSFFWTPSKEQYLRMLAFGKDIVYGVKFDFNDIATINEVDIVTGNLIQKVQLNAPNTAEYVAGFDFDEERKLLTTVLKEKNTLVLYQLNSDSYAVKSKIDLKLNTTFPLINGVFAFERYSTTGFFYMMYSMTNNSQTITYFASLNPATGELNTLFNVPTDWYSQFAGVTIDQQQEYLYINQGRQSTLMTIDMKTGLVLSNVSPDLHVCLGSYCRLAQISLG